MKALIVINDPPEGYCSRERIHGAGVLTMWINSHQPGQAEYIRPRASVGS